MRAQGGANPVIPLLADLRGQVKALDTAGIGAGQAVHTSLTSQDVLDTALMLLARNALPALLADLKRTTAALAALAEEHADTLCVGRSLTQHSLPFTFGLKAAQWFHGLAAAARRLEAAELPVQLGGAAGTLAAGTVLTTGAAVTPFDLSDSLAAGLGLAGTPGPWHTNRLASHRAGRRAGRGDGCAGQDRRRCAVPEPPRGGRARRAARRRTRRVLGHAAEAEPGALRAGPQRSPARRPRRPPSCTSPRPTSTTNAPTAPGTPSGRPSASCSAWPSAPPGSLRELAEGLQVFPDAMRRNLDLSGPLLLSEGVVRRSGTASGGADGKQQLQAVVDRTLQAPAADQAAIYRRLLRAAVPAELLSDARLEELLDPASYLGQAAEISRRILAAFPDYARRHRSRRGRPSHHRLPT